MVYVFQLGGGGNDCLSAGPGVEVSQSSTAVPGRVGRARSDAQGNCSAMLGEERLRYCSTCVGSEPSGLEPAVGS